MDAAFSRRSFVRRAGIGLGVLVSAGRLVPSVFAAPASVATDAGTLMKTLLADWSNGTGGSYASGFWTLTGVDLPGYWFRCACPAAASAIVAAKGGGSSQHVAWARDTINANRARYQQPDGSFGTGYPQDNSIETMEFMRTIGVAYLLVGGALGASDQAAWKDGLARASDYLVANGNLSWYTNGNVCIGNAAAMWFAYAVTGDSKHLQRYQQALTFAKTPGSRWPGCGLVFSKKPKKSDWSDGAGYLTESGSGAPPAGEGLDWDYLQVQVDYCAQLYAFNRDPKILQLLNVFLNQMWSRVNTTTWMYDATGGTRHSQVQPLLTAAPARIARTMPGWSAAAQFAKAQQVYYQWQESGTSPAYAQGFVTQLGTLLL